MSNILIVSGSYYPYASANAVCMKEFEKAFIKKGDNVTYIIKRHDIDTEEKTMQDGVEIFHVPRTVEEFYITCEKLKKVKKPQPMEWLFKTSLFVIKSIVTLYAKIRYGSVRKYSEVAYIDDYAKKIDQIVKEKKIDTIVSISMPFLSHVAVLKYFSRKDAKKITWIPFMIDAYSQKYAAEDVQTKIEEELKIMEVADKVIMLDVLKESYENHPFFKYKNKFYYVPLPLLNFEDNAELEDGIIKEKEKIDCVFAGTLYDTSSSVYSFAEFVKELDCEQFRFHFMGKIYPENLSFLEKLQQECRSEIIIYGVMPIKFAYESVKKADIVINIGNMNTNQIPSKVFQYISEKKMILTFYKIQDDPAMELLEKYPLSYNIYEKEMNLRKSVEEFKKFYEKNKNVELDVEDLKKIYAGKTTQDVCNKFLEYIH